jgi:hypothetical protein
MCSVSGGIIMRETQITLPELAVIAGTRAALGAGLAMLLADRLPVEQRKAVGWTLILIGALTTVPLGIEVLGRNLRSARERWPEAPESGNRSQVDDRLCRRGVSLSG